MTHLSNFKTSPYRALLSVCAVMFVCLSFGGVVAANETADRKFSKKIGKATVEALDLINRQDYEAAAIKLESLLKKKKLSAYERSAILQMSGQAYYNLDQPERAIEAFESAIEAGGLLPSEEGSLIRNTALLYLRNKEYVRGAEMLEQWEGDGNILKPTYFEPLVTAWVMSEHYDRALPWAEAWFETSNPKQRKHYDLLNVLYNHLGQTEKRMNLLQVMAEKWPNDRAIKMALEPATARTAKTPQGIPSFMTPAPENRGSFKISVNDRDAQPIVRIPPIVPSNATVSGHCVVRFNVTPKGKPFDVKTSSCTDYIFERAAIESVEKWKFSPKIREAKETARIGVETRIKFRITDGPE